MSNIFLLLIVVAAAVGIPVYLKKKKNKAKRIAVSTRQNKDEVWKAIKHFLKMNGEYGVEISDSYVVKRQHENYIDSKLSKEEKQKKKIEIKERRQHKKQQDKENKKAGKPAIYNKVRDLYVVVFSTKNSKNNTVNPPRCIECEVVNTQVSKKDFSRSIHILGERNYEQEMKWIAPIREAETKKLAKQQVKTEKQIAKQLEKDNKKKQKEIAKKNKNGNK